MCSWFHILVVRELLAFSPNRHFLSELLTWFHFGIVLAALKIIRYFKKVVKTIGMTSNYSLS